MKRFHSLQHLRFVERRVEGLGGRFLPFWRRIAAAWRASTWTIAPAEPSTSFDLIDGAAPL